MIHSVPVRFARLRVVLFRVLAILLLAFSLLTAPVSLAQTSTTATSGTVIIKSGDEWQVWDKGIEPPTSANWATGRSPFGYQPFVSSYPISSSVAATSVASGRATVFFQKEIKMPVNLPASYFVLRYRRDDGLLIRLNGQEIGRDNLPVGPLSLSATATEPVTVIDANWYTVVLPQNLFEEGSTARLVVELHQQANSDADLFFDLELIQYAYSSVGPIPVTELPVRSGDAWKVKDFTTAVESGSGITSQTDYSRYRTIRASGSPARISFGNPGDANPATTPVTSFTTYGIVPVPTFYPFGNPAQPAYLNAMNTDVAIRFAKTIMIRDLKQFASINLNVMNGGNNGLVVVYVNGRRVYSGSRPDVDNKDPFNFTSGAYIGSSDAAYTNPLSVSAFTTGENTILVDVVPRLGTRQLAFNLELTGNPARAYAPVASRIQSQTAFVGQPLSYTIPAFGDNNLDSLTYKLTGSLPGSLSFNAASRIITGTTTTTGISSLSIAATDPGGLSAVAAFTITVLDPPKLLRGPYLQNATTSGMTFRFRTDVPCVGRVTWGTSHTDEDSARIDHVVSLTSLGGNTSYTYTIGCANGAILDNNPANVFRTNSLPIAGQKTRIWSLGDFGIGTTRQTNVRKAFENYVKSIGNPDINLWLWLGDNSYEGTDPEFQKYVFSRDTVASPFAYGNSRFLRQTPIYAVPGNHDYLGGETRTTHKIPYFDLISPPTKGEAGGVASGKKEYYSFNYNNIHFVALDSYGFEAGTGHQRIFDPAGPQITWLKRDLAAAQTDSTIKWIVAFWHHPPYSRGTHNTDTAADLIEIRQNIIPILEQYRVDLVMNGHSHVYERSGLMRGLVGDGNTYNLTINRPADAANAKATGKFDGSANSCFYVKSSKTPLAQHEGTVYMVNGSGGAGGNVQASWPHPAMVTAYNAKGASMYLEVDGGRLDAKTIDEDGKIIDQFTIFKDTCPPTLPQGITCACGGKTMTPPPALSLLTPGFDCKTGSLTFVTAGGDGSKIEYQLTGQTTWTTTATARVNNLTALLGNPAISGSLTLLTRQSSTTLVAGFDARAFCPVSSTGSSSSATSGSTTTGTALVGILTILPPTYNCQTGAIVLRTSGGNGSPITFTTPGVQRDSPASTSGTVEAGVRNDAKTLTITATQSGTTVTYSFDLKAACSGSGREGIAENTGGLQITVFGNPTTNATVDVEIRGAEGQPLRLQLADAQGKIWTNHALKSARMVERQTVTLGQSAGVYVLTISSDIKRETVKIVRE